jgi:hypothetical protein
MGQDYKIYRIYKMKTNLVNPVILYVNSAILSLIEFRFGAVVWSDNRLAVFSVYFET